jgi:hypothetical protein
VRDTTADAYGGWAFVTGQLAGGGQHAQRIVTMRQYNMEHAKKIARRAVGIGEFRKTGDENWKAALTRGALGFHEEEDEDSTAM